MHTEQIQEQFCNLTLLGKTCKFQPATSDSLQNCAQLQSQNIPFHGRSPIPQASAKISQQHMTVWACFAGGILEIFLFILVAGLVAHFIGAGIHEGIFVGALVCTSEESTHRFSKNSARSLKHFLHKVAMSNMLKQVSKGDCSLQREWVLLYLQCSI